MTVSRAPHPRLRPLIERLWTTDSQGRPDTFGLLNDFGLEAVLPTGLCHLAIRCGAPYRIFEPGDMSGPRTVSCGVIGGPRSRRYIKAIGAAGPSVGALLSPGAIPVLFGVPASDLAERHTALEDVWGAEAHRLVDALAECREPAARLNVLEAHLMAKQGTMRVTGLHPAIAEALTGMGPTARITAIRAHSGLSRRQFDALFREGVGLTPKRCQRLVRFRAALTQLSKDTALADIALAAGFSDQAHFQNDFRDITGVTPGHYRSLQTASPYHLPLGG